jgi:hypothetical protein
MLSVLIQICLGVGYSWSSFVPALKHNFGLTIAETQTIFGISSLIITLSGAVCSATQQISVFQLPLLSSFFHVSSK